MMTRTQRTVLGWRVALMLIALHLLTGCALAAGARPVQVDQQADGRTLGLARGQRLVVALASNPTTGYRWEMVPVEGACLDLVGEAQFTPQSNLIGAGASSA
ncbi:MAG: protease inhibitor I42 family protein [Chloroflexota bacterium]